MQHGFASCRIVLHTASVNMVAKLSNCPFCASSEWDTIVLI